MANGARNGMVAHEEQAPKRQRTANAALLVGAPMLAPVSGRQKLCRPEHTVTSRLTQATAAVATCLPSLAWNQLKQCDKTHCYDQMIGKLSFVPGARAGQQPGHELGGGDDAAGDQPAPGEPADGARGAGQRRQGGRRGQRAAQLAGRQRVRCVRADAAHVRAAQRVLHLLRAAHQAQPGACPGSNPKP